MEVSGGEPGKDIPGRRSCLRDVPRLWGEGDREWRDIGFFLKLIYVQQNEMVTSCCSLLSWDLGIPETWDFLLQNGESPEQTGMSWLPL